MAHTEEKAFELIKSAHERDRLAHAFLIIGKEADGTHSLAAKIVALLNYDPKPKSDGLDLFADSSEVEEEVNVKAFDDLPDELVRVLKTGKKSRIISIKAMREFEKSFYSSAPKNKWNIGIIVEADRMNDQSANAFLKTLEEPPRQTLLILLTSKPELLLPTILSRCVNINLLSTQAPPSESEMKLIQSISSQCKNGFDSDLTALRMKSIFSEILATRKEEITKCYDAALKEEHIQYSKSTDGLWLKDREDYYKARIEIDYLYDRSQLVDTLVSWFGDIVREKCNFTHLDYPQLKKTTSRIADSQSIPALIKRMNALESLRDALNTNADEKLALETGFMQTFG